ncbi:MAG: phosphoglucomutase/phosphomannomutase family protein [Chloroflexota bacterium]
MKNPIKFGTDGWRGIIAEDFTFDNVRICAQGVADYLKKKELAHMGLVIGYDTRFASEDFARAAAEVISGNGIKVYLCPEATPTPVVSYGVVAKQAAGAIMITASHNPCAWNGFKYKTQDGASAPQEVVSEIEKNIARILSKPEIRSTTLASAGNQGLLEYFNIAPSYFTHISRLVDFARLRQANIKVVIDPMFGAGIGYLKSVLEGGTIELTEINGTRNPLFPGIKQPEPIAANLASLSAKIKEQGANIGIATDGDADRAGIMDENGVFLTTLQTFALLCLYLLEVRKEQGLIVKTITTGSMPDRLGEIFGDAVRETKVGFKYVAPLMIEENALIGGEESGGYGFRGHVPERDGILAGLYFLDLMQKTGKSPSELISYLYSKVGPHYFNRWDMEFPEEERQEIIKKVKGNVPQTLDGVKVLKMDTLDGFRFNLADKSWLLIRFSGTEPLLRIYAETDSPERVERLLGLGKELAGL